MAWGINLSGMDSIRSFKQAQDHWAGEAPWGNKHASWRPLQNRRKEHVRLVRLADETGYECVLYNTPVVTYYANGDVKVVGYDSSATNAFAWYTTPAGIVPVSANGNMYWQVDTPEGTRFYRDNKYLMLTPAPNRGWQLLNEPVVDTEKVLDRKKAAAVRKLLSHYDKWDKMTDRLMGNTGRVWPRYPQRHDIRILLDSPQDPELFAKLHNSIGPVSGFRETAYELMGAYDEITVTHDRLPRKKK